MNTDTNSLLGRRRMRVLLGALLVALACSGDTHVGCSPTLTCSLRPSRFAAPVTPDAGATDCAATDEGCPAAQLSLGGQHACAISDAGNLYCWGDDSQAQRGPNLDAAVGPDAGSYRNGFSHVADGVLQVSAGAQHTCALLDPATVLCWGRNVEGQIDGARERSVLEQPVPVSIAAVKQLAAGAWHTCALTDTGITCWGSSLYGQAGRDPADTSAAPRLVTETQAADEVSCGVRHCCLRRADKVACWGELIDAQGQPYVSLRPVPVEQLDGVLQVSAGAGHSCALKPDGVMCWGLNDDGQLGDGTTRASAVPVSVPGVPAGAGFVAAGGGEHAGHLAGHACAVDRAGQVLCWGRNAEGQLGRVISADHLKPEAVQAYDPERDDILNRISRVALGAFFSCALGSRGAVYCWGDDSFDQLGNDWQPEHARRVPVAGEALRVQRFGRMR